MEQNGINDDAVPVCLAISDKSHRMDSFAIVFLLYMRTLYFKLTKQEL